MVLPEAIEVVPLRLLAYRMAEIATSTESQPSGRKLSPPQNTSMPPCVSGKETTVLPSAQQWPQSVPST